ncbi:MAG: hypothetical protein IJH20_00955 [Bacilli bacterium]|nr:hypothetical protein [Bacilli bacterium]
MHNYGYQNEYDFVELFNNKNLDELDNNSKIFLRDIFGEIIDSKEKIIAWKNKVVQKADIFIKYKGYIKRISLKCGNSNSIHHEQIQEFNMYLKKLEIPYKYINIYNNYHYGYLRNNDGFIDFSNHVSSEEYKKMYQKDIDLFNKEINKTKIIMDMVDRFIIRGKNSEYDIDALICGKIDDYVWIKKYEIYDLILFKRNYKHTSPHISCLTIGPKKRNLNGNSKNWKEKYIVCVRWNFIRESIIEFKNYCSTTVT